MSESKGVPSSAGAHAGRLDLCQLRKQAKELLRGAREGSEPARRRFAAAQIDAGASPQLALAQWVVAREQGFESWAKLKAAWERQDLTRSEQAAALVEAALDDDAGRVKSLLDSDRALARWNFATALVMGEGDMVEEMLEDEPALARQPISKRGMPPLFLCTRSCVVKHSPGREAGFAACISALVKAGADVNQQFEFDAPFGKWRGSPLYYVAGVHGNKVLTALLLSLGATPNDGETLYHATEQRDAELLRLLHTAEGGVDLGQWSYALLHLLDAESPDCVRAMLELGVDLKHVHPQSGETALHWAILRGRSPEIIGMLLDAGADPGDTDYLGVSAYAKAARFGDVEAVALMEQRGYRQSLSIVDRFLLAAIRGDGAEVARLREAHPTETDSLGRLDGMVIVRAADLGRTDAVRGLLRLAKVDPGTADHQGATALHMASLRGFADTAQVLIEAGAPLEAVESEHHATPIGWCTWGSLNLKPRSLRAQYGRTVELLLGAGAKTTDDMWGSAEVLEAFRKHGVHLVDR